MDRSFSNILDRTDYDVASDPGALAPERALVFEVIGSLSNFANTARRVGLEWLSEQVAALVGVEDYLDLSPDDATDEQDAEESDEDENSVDDLEAGISGTLYVGMPTIDTFNRLRALWNSFKRGEQYPKDHSDWWQLFAKLHDLRTWGPSDRVQPAVREHISRTLQRSPSADINLELDLWYRDAPESRVRSIKDLKGLIEKVGGELLDSDEIAEIKYQAALVRIPPDAAQSLIGAGGPLALADEIMSVRPQSLFSFTAESTVASHHYDRPAPVDRDERPSLAALIDGFPIEQHHLLSNRLDVIALDVTESQAPLIRRFHGTAMASLILHGDLAGNQPQITRVLKVVPILQPNSDGIETPPADRLTLSLVHRAVKELKEGLGSHGASGKDVVLINHSICDESLPFAGATSPWARLLDYLSFKYKVLFVISAGNIRDAFPIETYISIPEFRTADPRERQNNIMIALEASKARRSVLPPAEAVNAITVGAVHRDHCVEPLTGTAIDPFPALGMVNLGSGLGLGVGRAIKPDLVMPGGRQVAHPVVSDGMTLHARDVAAFGQTVAMPDVHGGSQNATRRCSGTSNAAALTTRAGLLISDALDATFDGNDEPWYAKDTAPCLLKALIAHSASWGDIGEHLGEIYPPRSKASRRRENISRFLGYGEANAGRILDADQHRITFLAQDKIRIDKRHEYAVPLPDELSSRTDARRITITLAWLTPVRSHSANYRSIALDVVSSGGNTRVWQGVKRIRHQPPLGTSTRGTLMHMCLDGRNAVPYLSDSEFVLNVQARSRLTGLRGVEVPYALAVTFEVASTINADIAQSIRNKFAQKVRV